MEKNIENVVEATHQLDSSLGGVLINLESLKAIAIEMGRIREDVDNTDKTDLPSMGVRFRDIEHKLVIIDELLRYAVVELESNYEECQAIKMDLHFAFVDQGNGEDDEG